MKRLFIFIFFCFLLLIPAVGWSASYYIDFESGDDSNNGTATETPWKHFPGISDATDTAAAHTPSAGNTYYLKASSIHRGPIYLEGLSGTAASKIKIDDYGEGDKPIVTSRYRNTEEWSGPDGNGIYTITVDHSYLEMIWIGDSDEDTWGTIILESSDSTPGDSEWYSSGSTVKYNPGASDPVPGDSGFFLEYSISSSGNALQSMMLDDCHYFEIRDINFTRSCFHGLKMVGSSSYIYIYDSNFDYNGMPKNYRYNGYYRGSIGNGIEMMNAHHVYVNTSTANYNYDNGLTVERADGTPKPYNIYFNGCEGAYNGGSGGSVKGGTEALSYGVFKFCSFHHNGNMSLTGSNHYSTSGIKTNRGQLVILNCGIFDNYGAGVEFVTNANANAASVVHGSLIINNNTGDHELDPGSTEYQQDAGILIHTSYGGSGSTITITNNTISAYGTHYQDHGIHQYLSNSGTADLLIKNNIIYGHNDYDIKLDAGLGSDYELETDHNSFSGSNPSEAVISTSVDDYNVADAAIWNALSYVGTDYFQDPLFTNAAGDDYSITDSSPCKDAGLDLGDDYQVGLDDATDWSTSPPTVLTLIQDDYGSDPWWEIGAYVYQDTGTGGEDPPSGCSDTSEDTNCVVSYRFNDNTNDLNSEIATYNLTTSGSPTVSSGVCYGGITTAAGGAGRTGITFWLNAEGTWETPTYTIGASEHSEGDTTGTVNSSANITEGSKKIGSYGIDIPTSGDYFKFAVDADDIVSDSEGRIGFYVYYNGTDDNTEFIRVEWDSDNYFAIRMQGADELTFYWKDDGSIRTALDTAAANLASSTWYYIEFAWKTSTNYREIWVNGNSEGTSDATINDLATTPDGLYIGNNSGNTGDYYLDQIIISDDSTKDLNAIRDDTSYVSGGDDKYAYTAAFDQLTDGDFSVAIRFRFEAEIDDDAKQTMIGQWDAGEDEAWRVGIRDSAADTDDVVFVEVGTDGGAVELESAYDLSPNTEYSAVVRFDNSEDDLFIHIYDSAGTTELAETSDASLTDENAQNVASSQRLSVGVADDGDLTDGGGEEEFAGTIYQVDFFKDLMSEAEGSAWAQGEYGEPSISAQSMSTSANVTSAGTHTITIVLDREGYMENGAGIFTITYDYPGAVTYTYVGKNGLNTYWTATLSAGYRIATIDDGAVSDDITLPSGCTWTDAQSTNVTVTGALAGLSSYPTHSVLIAGTLNIGTDGDFAKISDLTQTNTDIYTYVSAVTDNVEITADNVIIMGYGRKTINTGTLTFSGNNCHVRCVNFSGEVTGAGANGNTYHPICTRGVGRMGTGMR